MRVGYDAKRLFTNFTGLGNYSRTLVANLHAFFPQLKPVLYTKRITSHSRTQEFLHGEFEIKSPSKFNILWRNWLISRQLSKDNIELYHGLSAQIPFGLSIPSVVTIHDLIFETHPQQYSFFDQKIYSAKARYACKRANKIIAISQTTKHDIIRFYKIPESKIKVIYQTCDAQFFAEVPQDALLRVYQTYQLPQTYLLYVGSIIERKNLFELVKAVESLRENAPPLIVIGEGKNAYAKRVYNYVKTNQLENKIHFLRNVKFSDFPAIYKAAEILIYPSSYEGFGIPIIEAQAVGTPVITSNHSCLPEAAGKHSILLNNIEYKSIAKAIQNILSKKSLQQKMSREGLQYVQRFSAEKVTTQVMKLYEEILR